MRIAPQLAGLLLLIVLVTASALADTIHLKNGASITAEKVREKGDQVEYTLGVSTYTIPRSMVDRIEHSGSFGVTVTQPAPGAAYRDPGFSSGAAIDSIPDPKPRAKLSGAPPSTLPGNTKERDSLRPRSSTSAGLTDVPWSALRPRASHLPYANPELLRFCGDRRWEITM